MSYNLSWIALAVCSACLILIWLVWFFNKCMEDSGLNNRIIIVSGERVNEAPGGKLDILDDEEEELTTVISGSLSACKVYLKKISSEEAKGESFMSELVIGREPRGTDGLFVVHDPDISRLHCRVFREQGALYLEDLNSRNHTYLNGRMVLEPQLLNNGDIISMGNETYQFQYLE